MHRLAWTLPGLAVLLSACSLVPSASPPTASPPAPQASASASARTSTSTSASVSARTSTGAGATHSAAARTKDPAESPAPASSRDPTALPTLPDAKSGGGPGRFAPTGHGRLNGKVILIDPGHNGGNFAAASVINRLIWNGRESETCDTTGAETDAGYTEALFNWRVALYLTADLRAAGATVVLTRTSDTGVGPCVTERAAIGNEVHANAAVSIHADGGPPGGRGFAILEPVADGINNAIVGPSAVLGADLRAAFAAGTGEPVSSYDGVNGIQPRDDLAGINLSTVPKAFIECANMRDAADAVLVTSARWQVLAARAIAVGLTAFVLTRH
jgi:N-acetylmuramoyl-L-alanine amidase